jgi:HK97 family phage major capsid protein
MPYNTLVQRSDVGALIPQRVSNMMLTSLTDSSAALALGTRIPMPAGSTRFPVLSALPQAYWVNGDTGLKQTTGAAWDEKYINVEELAAIVPVPENVLDDSEFDLWGAVRPLLEAAISRQFDQAVFFGVSKPASFPTDIATAASAAGNEAVQGTNAANAGGLAQDLADLVATLETDGYVATGGLAKTTMRGLIRKNRDTTGKSLGEVTVDNWYGADIRYPMRGLWPSGTGTTLALVGDFEQMAVGVRRDFSYKILTESVITDGSGAVIFNLPQQDMIALRVVFRAGWQLANPINWDQPDESARYPFARLKAA